VILKRTQHRRASRVLSAALLSCALLVSAPFTATADTSGATTIPGVLIMPPASPATGPEGFWTTPTSITLIPEAPGRIYYRFGAGPGTWTPCTGPVAVPEGKQVLSAVLVSPDGTPGETVSTVVRSDFSVTPIVGVGAKTSSSVTYSGAGTVSGAVTVKAQVRAQVGTTVRRLGGADRYQVSSLIADTSFGSAQTVIIASGETFPDALSASGLAGCYNAPLLLVQRSSVPSAISSRIRALGAKKAIVCGGPATVSDGVVSTLRAKGLAVERIGGIDRYQTATMIARRIAGITGGGGTVYVARGDAYPDALSLSPLAYVQKAPILLTEPRSLNSRTRSELSTGGYRSSRIAGGGVAIGYGVARRMAASVENQIRSYVPDTVRWGGDTRYEVAVKCATEGVAQGSNTWVYVGVARGDGFADALGGGIAAGSRGGVVLLTTTSRLNPKTANAMTAHAGETRECDVYGGTVAVSTKTYEQIHGIFR